MSHSHSGFTKVVNTNVQTSSILNGVAGALSSISSTPGFTGYTIITPTTVNTVLDGNALLSISESGILLLDGSSTFAGDRDVAVCLGDTKENAQALIKIFKLESSNPKLITVAKVGATNANFAIYLANNEYGLTTTNNYVEFTFQGGNPNYRMPVADRLATKNGYISVTKVSDTKIVFDIVQKQLA
jgi:hypothetical protein